MVSQGGKSGFGMIWRTESFSGKTVNGKSLISVYYGQVRHNASGMHIEVKFSSQYQPRRMGPWTQDV